MHAGLQGVERLDALVQLSIQPDVQYGLGDVLFDAQAGELLHIPKLNDVRQLPAHTMQMTVLAMAPEAVESDGTRELGRHTFRHRP